MKTIFIVNPLAAKGEGKLLISPIEKVMKVQSMDYEILMTECPHHATKLAGRYHQKDDVQIISCGGDGTLHETLNGLHTGISLGMIPCGTGNDFYRMIGSKVKNMEEHILATVQGDSVMIDYGIINGRKFINAFSIGLDASIACTAKEVQARSSRNLGSQAYLRATLKEVMHPSSINIHLEMEGMTVHQKAILVSAFNGKWYGGGFKAAPHANMQDGLFDVVVVDMLSTPRILPLLPRYMSGKYENIKAVKTFRTNRFTLLTDYDTDMQVDGELGRGKQFELQVIHNGVSLKMPKGEKYAIRE